MAPSDIVIALMIFSLVTFVAGGIYIIERAHQFKIEYLFGIKNFRYLTTLIVVWFSIALIAICLIFTAERYEDTNPYNMHSSLKSTGSYPDATYYKIRYDFGVPLSGDVGAIGDMNFKISTYLEETYIKDMLGRIPFEASSTESDLMVEHLQHYVDTSTEPGLRWVKFTDITLIKGKS